MKPGSSRGLGRRAFLLLASLLSPLAWRRAHAQPRRVEVGAEEFIRLSSRLTGRSALDPELAATYLKALVAVPGNAVLLGELARNGSSRAQMTPQHVALEEEIITSWYLGTYRAGGTTQLATHTGALVWSAIGRPAPGMCAGPTGSWSKPLQSR